MSILPRSISSILFIVIFIVLAIFASLAYNSSSDSSGNLEDNQFLQGSKVFMSKALVIAKSLTNVNLTKTPSLTDKMSDELIAENISNSSQNIINGTADKIISFEKTDEGLEIILKIKNEEERKLLLPFKF